MNANSIGDGKALLDFLYSNNEKNAKLGQKWSVMWSHVIYFWNFGTPDIFWTNEARNFKFGT